MTRALPRTATCVAVLAMWSSPALAAPVVDPIFGLSFAIARDPSAKAPAAKEAPRIVDDAWVQAQIDDANRFFEPLGTRFRWTLEKDLDEPHGELHSRADRDALTPLMESKVIDVFVVRDLEDVDEPGRFRMGVCWTGRANKRFIVIARTARPTVLAHELGHFFGNPHTTVTDNLMSYSRSGGPISFDEHQLAMTRAFATRFVTTGRLLPLDPPRLLP